MASVVLNIGEARRLVLQAQGLLKQEPFGRGKAATLKAIEQLGYIQIDAISVIERAHHHALWTRVQNYKKSFLDELIAKDKKVFEYWSHAVSFLPMKNLCYYRWRMQHIQGQKKHWYDVDNGSKMHVLSRLENEGPLFARDFEAATRSKGDMWNYSPAKQALHELFMEGKVMAVRHNFQRKYDISERALPANANVQCPDDTEVACFFIKSYLQAQGLGTARQITYQQTELRDIVNSGIEYMLASGMITKVKIKRSDTVSYYALTKNLDSIPVRASKYARFLSPFDNVAIQRDRLSGLFDFDYQTEIYYAKDKRKYGYFSMPILYGSEFIGRIDPKADRVNNVLIINNLQIDHHIRITEQLKEALVRAAWDFAKFNKCNEISLLNSNIKVDI